MEARVEPKKTSHVALGHPSNSAKIHVISKLGKNMARAKCGAVVLLGAKWAWIEAWPKKDYESMRIAGMICGRCAKLRLRKSE